MKLCEISKDADGWECMEYKDNKWVDVGKFDEVKISGKEVLLPIAAGKVIFEHKKCESITEKGIKILVCKSENSPK